MLLAGGRVIAEGTADALKDLLGPATIRVRLADPGDADRARQALATLDPEVRTDEATVTLPATPTGQPPAAIQIPRRAWRTC